MSSKISSSPSVATLLYVIILTIFIFCILNIDILSPCTQVSKKSTTVQNTRPLVEPQTSTVPEKTSSSLLKESAKENYFIVFVIPTHPQKVQQRNVIRNTWANVDKWSLLANQEKKRRESNCFSYVGISPLMTTQLLSEMKCPTTTTYSF